MKRRGFLACLAALPFWPCSKKKVDMPCDCGVPESFEVTFSGAPPGECNVTTIEWIDVKDRLPELVEGNPRYGDIATSCNVLVSNGDSRYPAHVAFCQRFHGEEAVWWCGTHCMDSDIAYWAELPLTPAQLKGETP